jgi:transcriptional regulator with XRE-family HTH domain
MNTSEPFRSLDMDTAAADPSLVGYRLAQLRLAQNITPEQQAEALGIDRERLTTLCSCRLPRDQAELKMIAARIGWEAGRLAGLLGVHYTGEVGS